MIKKVIKIKGVGKFENYVPKVTTNFSGDFKNIVLIYGINGSGKSTLVSIIRSLKGDNSLILRHKTFHLTGSPEVDFLIDGISKPFSFSNHKWTDNYTDIEIFDSHFISENVFTGFVVDTEHKRKLFDIILGQKGIQLKSLIEKIKIDIKDEQTNLNQCIADINTFIGYIFDAKKFCNLTEVEEVEKRVAEKEHEIQLCKSSAEIKNTNNLKLIDFSKLGFDFNNIKTILEKSINTISEEYLKKVEQHKNHFPIGEQTEQWIKLGYDNIKDDTCPFCERPFDSTSEIITAYNQYFNQEYLQLQKDSKELNDLFTSFNLPLVLSEIELTITTNTTLVDFWKPHTKIDFYDEVLLQEKETLLTLFNNVKELIQQKANNPIKVQIIETLIEFQEKLNEEVSRFKECNKIISQYNTRIDEIKNAPSKSFQTLEEELKSLKLNQLRFSEKGKELAKKYLDIETKIASLNTDKEKKQEELRKHTTTTLSTYKVTINKLLKKFATYMEIKEIKSAYVSTSKIPSVEYALSVSGNNVKLNDDGINPSFKYVLSEGDKSALAISFFFAMLIEDQKTLAKKIVLFDDPVSSFDRSRQFETVKILHWVASSSKQLFVLTHNLAFAGEFYYQYQKRSEIQSLQIYQANNQSHLEKFLIEVETLPDVLKDLNTVTKYLKNGAKDDSEKIKIKRCLRPILEGYFKMKFYGVVQDNDWLGSFINKTRDAKVGDKLHHLQDHLTELEAVNDWTSESHHGSTGQQTIDDNELRTHTEMTIELLEKI